MTQTSNIYLTLKQGGFSNEEIRGHLQPKLENAGFADQEINAYFTQYESISDYWTQTQNGFSNEEAQLFFHKHLQPNRENAGLADMGMTAPSMQDESAGGPRMQNGGDFSNRKIRDDLQRKLENAGLAGQEMNAAPRQDESADDPSVADYFMHGLQGSVSGLWYRAKLPDTVSAGQLAHASTGQRLSLDAGSFLGDIPTLLAGGALGALGGPAAPVTIPAGAIATTEGIRASYIDRIQNGKVGDFWYMGGVAPSLIAAGKGAAVGAATGGMGGIAGGVAMRLGAGALGKAAATVGAEALTMPTVASALDGRFPEPRDFVDAAMFLCLFRAVRPAVRSAYEMVPKIVPKVRELYVKTGKTPQEMVEIARKDPTLAEDILADNREMPRRFAEETWERVKAGEEVPSEELGHYLPRTWAKALLTDRSGAQAISEGIGRVMEWTRLKKAGERFHWGFITSQKARALAEEIGSPRADLPDLSGYVHSIDPIGLGHAIKNHGSSAETLRGQVPITYEDALRIPDIVATGKMTLSPDLTDQHLFAVMYEKAYGDTHFVVEEVRTGKKELAFQTMYKRKEKGGSPLGITSETMQVGPSTPNGELPFFEGNKASGIVKGENGDLLPRATEATEAAKNPGMVAQAAESALGKEAMPGAAAVEGTLEKEAPLMAEQAMPPTLPASLKVKDVKTVTAAEANVPFIHRGWEPPYASTTPVEQFTLATKVEGEFVRVYTEGATTPAGRFFVRAKDIEGMTPDQIKQHLALPSTPTHIVDVTIPAGTRIQTGKIAAQPKFGVSKEGGWQFELLELIAKTNFHNNRRIR